MRQKILICGNFLLGLVATTALAQDSLNVSMVGRLDFWDSPQNSAIYGNYLYVATYNTGLRVLDVSDPAHPVEVYASNTQDLMGAKDVKIVDNLVYVAGNGISVLDLTNPAAPQEIGFIGYPSCTLYGSRMVIQRSYAYLGGYDHLYVVDISDPTHPDSVGSCYIPDQVLDMKIRGNYLYLCCYGFGLYVMDISNPTHPLQGYLIEFTNCNVNGVDILNQDLYLATDNGLFIYSLTQPSQPQLINSYCTMAFNDIKTSGDLVYLAAGQNGLRIVNFSNPYFPFELGYFTREHANFWKVTLTDYFAFISDYYNWNISIDTGIRIVDISSPFFPFEIGHYTTPGWCNAVMVRGNYAFMANDAAGLVVIEISDPTLPTVIGQCVVSGTALKVNLNGDNNILLNTYTSLFSIDIHDPTHPYISDSTSDATYMDDFAIQEDFAYVACGPSIPDLRIYNIADPDDLYHVGGLNLTGDAFDIAVSGDYAYLTQSGSQYGINIVNISNPANPTFIHFYSTGNWPITDLQVQGDYLFYTGGSNVSSIGILNISDPQNPVLAATYIGPYSSCNINIIGDYVFTTCTTPGLRVLRLVNPLSLTLVGYYDTPGVAADATFDGNHIFVADKYYFEVMSCPSIVAVEEHNPSNLPTTFLLHTPFPNPFNPTAALSYQIPVNSYVCLRVYDVSGRLVTTLVDGWGPAGIHEVTFDGSRLASGLYFVRMQAADYTSVQKMMLIK